MLKSKTLWTAVAAIVGAIGGYFTGDLDLSETLQLVVTSALAVFLRHGVSKTQNIAEIAAEAASTVVPVVKKKATKQPE